MPNRTSPRPKAARKPKPTDPKIVKLPKQKMAVVVSHGDPNVVMPKIMPALYGAVYKHKFALKKAGKETFKVGALFGRWPDAHLVPKDQWTGIWGLPIPANTRTLPQPDPEVPVKIETWDYGKAAAEILHLGPYSEEGPTIQRLHEFIAASGYEIAGVHEEEYLTTPKAKVQKTIIRYPVKKREKG
jgi:hypothetical protein